MSTWFSSDTDFGHANIIHYCDRPYTSFSEMDDALVANWNQVVRPNDIVYHLGDFALGGREQAKLILLVSTGESLLFPAGMIKGGSQKMNIHPSLDTLL